jgi:hypothetical protein
MTAKLHTFIPRLIIPSTCCNFCCLGLSCAKLNNASDRKGAISESIITVASTSLINSSDKTGNLKFTYIN